MGLNYRDTNPGRLDALATKFCMVVPNIFSIITAVFFLTYKNVQHPAESTRRQSGSEVNPWVLSVELAL